MVVNFLTRALSEPINQLEKSDWMCKVFVRDFYVRSHWLFIGKLPCQFPESNTVGTPKPVTLSRYFHE